MRCPAALALLALAVLPTVGRAIPLDGLDPGTDWHVRRLRFEGNRVVSTNDLRRAMATRARLRLAVWRPLPLLDPIALRTDLQHLRRVYESRGHYEAQVAADLTLPATGTEVDVVIRIDEGEPVRVAEVEVDLAGNPFPQTVERDLRSALPLVRNQVFAELSYDRAWAYLRAFYRERGYARVAVERHARVDVQRHTAGVTYRVTSGPPSVFGEVAITGTKRVDLEVVRRELAFAVGDPFRDSLVERTRANLVALNLFRSVRVDEQPGGAVVGLSIAVTEAPPHDIRLGVGYDTEERLRGIAAWRDYDFFGDARQLGVAARASFIRRDILADFLQPHWPTRGSRIRLLFLEQQNDEDAYTLVRTRVGPRLEWQPTRALTAFAFYRAEYDSLGNINHTIQHNPKLSPLAPKNSVISGLGFGADWNGTDDPIDPREGWLASALVEPVGAALGGAHAFVRGIGEARLYQPLGLDVFLATRLRLGTVSPIDGSRQVPLFERFYAGGVNSIRGYGRYDVGPRVQDVVPGRGRDPIGGRSLIEGSLELRRPITEDLSLAIFADAGQVSLRTLDYPLDELSIGAGIGLRYRTPVGPVRIDLAFPANRRTGDATWQVHLGVGQAF